MAMTGTVIAITFIFIMIFGVGPNAVWLAIGIRYLHSPCNDGAATPTLALFLIVAGSVGIFNCLVHMITYFLIHPAIYAIISSLFSGFFLSWYIVGAIRLSEDDTCENNDTTLYNTALAAVIIGLVGVFYSLRTTYRQKADYEDNSA